MYPLKRMACVIEPPHSSGSLSADPSVHSCNSTLRTPNRTESVQLFVNLLFPFDSAECQQGACRILGLDMLMLTPATMGLAGIRLASGGIGLAVVLFVGFPVTQHGVHDVQPPPRERGHRRVVAAPLRPLSVVIGPRLVAKQDRLAGRQDEHPL